MSRLPVLLLLLLAPAQGGEAEPPCVIPKGPPCLSMRELREKLEQGSCVFEEESCITLQWDEYGKVVIKKAEIVLAPVCGDAKSAATFEAKGRAYIETLQTIPVEVTVVTKDCTTKGSVDVRVTEVATEP